MEHDISRYGVTHAPLVTSIQKYSKNGNGRAANLATAVQHN